MIHRQPNATLSVSRQDGERIITRRRSRGQEGGEGGMSDAHALIRYRVGARVSEWGVGCHAETDTDDKLKVHLAYWFPNYEFLGALVTRVSDGVVLRDTRRLAGVAWA